MRKQFLPLFVALLAVGTAQAANRWSDRATWPNRKVPVAGDKVEIASGKDVILDVSPPALGGVDHQRQAQLRGQVGP